MSSPSWRRPRRPGRCRRSCGALAYFVAAESANCSTFFALSKVTRYTGPERVGPARREGDRCAGSGDGRVLQRFAGVGERGPGQVLSRRLGDRREQVDVQARRLHGIEGLVRTCQRIRRRRDLERGVRLAHHASTRLDRRGVPERVVRRNGARRQDVLEILRLDGGSEHRALQAGLVRGDPCRQVGALVRLQRLGPDGGAGTNGDHLVDARLLEALGDQGGLLVGGHLVALRCAVDCALDDVDPQRLQRGLDDLQLGSIGLARRRRVPPSCP